MTSFLNMIQMPGLIPLLAFVVLAGMVGAAIVEKLTGDGKPKPNGHARS